MNNRQQNINNPFIMGYAVEPDVSGSPFAACTPDWAYEGSTGKNIKIAVIDSGIDATHPALEGCVKGAVEIKAEKGSVRVIQSDPVDSFGHGTACAGAIHSVAPDAEIYSVKVLGENLRARGEALIEGIKWAIKEGIPLINLSLGTTRQQHFGPLHNLVDRAYFNRLVMVAAHKNSPTPSFPAVFSSIIGVRAIFTEDPFEFYFSGYPPVEFLIKGVSVRLPWLHHEYETCTGNSFAAPHMTGIIALLLSKHPWLTPFMIKTILYSLAIKRGIYKE